MMRVELSIDQAYAIAGLRETATKHIEEIAFEEIDIGLGSAEREMLVAKMAENASVGNHTKRNE